MSENNNYKFYYPDRSPMNGREDFIHFYGQEYYCRIKDLEFDKHIEQDIFRSKEELSDKDIIDILRWKTGGECKDGKKIFISYPRKMHIDIEQVCGYVEGRHRGCCFNPVFDQGDGYKELIKSIVSEKDNGMGMVYTLTIIYFMSNGKYPIYDRFADIGRFAIINDLKPADGIKYKELSTSFEAAYKRYQGFANDLMDIFGEKEYTDRAVDRALWAYGHLFNLHGKKQIVPM